MAGRLPHFYQEGGQVKHFFSQSLSASSGQWPSSGKWDRLDWKCVVSYKEVNIYEECDPVSLSCRTMAARMGVAWPSTYKSLH